MSESFAEQRGAARTAARARSRARLARAGAGVTPEGAAMFAAERGTRAARSAGRTAAQARVVPGNRQYQPVILAEFLVAALLISVAPLATGGSPAAKAKGSPSPYDTGDLKQLVAVGAVYFVLALVSSGNHGRLAAWLGGLILIAIGMSKAGQAQLGAVFKTAGAKQPAGQQPSGAEAAPPENA